MNCTTIGIDVSKQKLDIFFSSSGEWVTLPNTEEGFVEFLKICKKTYPNIQKVIVEHTGSYQNALVSCLHINKIPVCVVHPTRVRNYAKAIGRLAKTDKIDAELLANYGEKMSPELSSEKPFNIQRLRSLVKYRKQLTDNLTLTKQWLEKKPDQEIVKQISQLVDFLNKQLSKIDIDIHQLIQSDKILSDNFITLTSTKGIGKVTAYILLAELPELGTICRNKIVAICGLAPLNRDSGTLRGKACIQGGRKVVRNALYMSVIAALRSNKHIRDFYDNLRKNGKPAKVAITACMRKMITHLNTELQKKE